MLHELRRIYIEHTDILILFILLNLGPFGPLEPMQDREGYSDPSQCQNKGGRTTTKK